MGKTIVGENLKSIIKAKGLKQCAVAVRAGYTPQKFSNMLCGRRAIKDTDIWRFCLALSVTPNELFGKGD